MVTGASVVEEWWLMTIGAGCHNLSCRVISIGLVWVQVCSFLMEHHIVYKRGQLKTTRFDVVGSGQILDLDLDAIRIQVGALGHTPTPFWSVYSCHLCFLPARWFPSLSPYWLCSSSWFTDDLDLSWTLEPPSATPVEVCAGGPFVSHVQASGVFFHWVCHPYCVVQFWVWPLRLLFCPSRKCPRCSFAVYDEQHSVFSLVIMVIMVFSFFSVFCFS